MIGMYVGTALGSVFSMFVPFVKLVKNSLPNKRSLSSGAADTEDKDRPKIVEAKASILPALPTSSEGTGYTT